MKPSQLLRLSIAAASALAAAAAHADVATAACTVAASKGCFIENKGAKGYRGGCPEKGGACGPSPVAALVGVVTFPRPGLCSEHS